MVDRELIGIPSVLIVSAVGINGAQHAVVDRHCQFMLEGMSGQRSMVDFDVHLEILVQTVCLQKADNRFGIHVILVLGGFHRLGFNEEGTGKSFAAGIVACQGQHLCQMFLFALLVRVEKGHISFAATPENIIHTAQLDCGIDGILDLDSSTGHDIKVRIRCRSVHITGM